MCNINDQNWSPKQHDGGVNAFLVVIAICLLLLFVIDAIVAGFTIFSSVKKSSR